jgi:hypothetical protein
LENASTLSFSSFLLPLAEAPASDAAASTSLTRAALALSQTRAAHAAAVEALEAVREHELARFKRVVKCSALMLRVLQAAAAVKGSDGQQEWPDWSKAREGVDADFVKVDCLVLNFVLLVNRERFFPSNILCAGEREAGLARLDEG